MSKAILKKGLGLRAVALVALALAVAFSVVLTSSQTAEAQATPATASPGDTVVVSWPGATDTEASPAQFRIDKDSDGTATFANGAQSISCYVDSAVCDVDRSDDGTPTSTSPGVQLRVTIDDDSPLGQIYVQRATRSGGDFAVVDTDEHTITVVAANPPVAIKAAGAPPAAAIPATNPTTPTPVVTLVDGNVGTVIGSQLVDARGKGLNGMSILVTTTRGVLNSNHVTAPATCANVSACTLTTQAEGDGPDTTADNEDDAAADGTVTVRLSGNGATGTATVTFRELNTGLSRSVNVVMHGAAASISAAVDESTISVGSSTFVVVTVLDADGNPVVGNQTADFENHEPTVPAIVGPDVPAGQSATLLDTSRVVDRDLPGTKNDLPSCGLRAAVVADPNADPPVEAAAGSNGTNTAGKCVIELTAAGGDTPDDASDDSTRGTHTLTVGLTDDAKIAVVSVEVTVGGAPDSISTDAPARVDSLSATEITITVMDDAGERVGAVAYSVERIEGEGRITAGATDADSMTSDGRAKFTYRAPRSGVALFLITAGTAPNAIEQTVEIQVGEEPEPPAPDAISLTLRAGGHFYPVLSGASTSAADLFGSSVTSAWKYNLATGTWSGYDGSSGRGGFMVNAGDVIYVVSPIDQTVGG